MHEQTLPRILNFGFRKVCVHPSPNNSVFQDALVEIKRKHVSRQSFSALESDWESGVIALASLCNRIKSDKPVLIAESLIREVVEAHKKSLNINDEGKCLSGNIRTAYTAQEFLNAACKLFSIGTNGMLIPKESSGDVNTADRKAMYGIVFSEPQRNRFKELGYGDEILGNRLDTSA